MRFLNRVRRVVALSAVLGVTALVVPDSGVAESPAQLVKVESVMGMAHRPHVVWILALGSDARPGQPVLRSRADAIQLVGINTRTGHATAIGIPRDSYVSIPGHGRNKINAAMYFGGPQLMADAVAGLVAIRPDYVVVSGFGGLQNMVRDIGGVTVRSRYAFNDAVGNYRVGENRLNGLQARVFAQVRKPFPRGDFDRSANQQALLAGILREVRAKADRPGFMERSLVSVARNLHTGVRPVELYRLAQAATMVQPSKFRKCVLRGGIGSVGGASVVFPDVAQARSIARRARGDARLEGGC